MKLWIEVDEKTGDLFLHFGEPNPNPDGPEWISNDYVVPLCVDPHLLKGKKIKLGTVAEFELKQIWERT